MLKKLLNFSRINSISEEWFELYSNKKYLLAEKKFNQLLEIDHNNKDALFYLCLIYDNMSNYQKLYETSLKLLQIDPTSLWTIGHHVRSLRKLYNDPQRELYFYELILTHPKNKKYEWDRWIAYYNCWQFEKSYESLKKAIVLNKDNNYYLNWFVASCIKNEKLNEAVKYHKKSEASIMSGKYISDSVFTDNDQILKNVK